MSEKRLSAGKLPLPLLKRFLRRYATGGRDVVVGPGIGLDSAVIDFRGRYLVAKTDPITFVAEDIGIYAIHINANDIAVTGATPKWFLATVLLPEGGATADDAERIFSQLSRACKGLGVALSGGHTEVSPVVARPVVVGQMLGVIKKGRPVTAAGARKGDDVILTKGIAIEGTSVIARSLGEELVKKGAFSRRFISRCRNFIRRPGIGVIRDAGVIMRTGGVHAMHDPTEGGLAAGLYEMAEASGSGMLIEKEAVPVFRETERLCRYFNIDPMGLIASGALLACIAPSGTEKAIRALKRAGIGAWRIGVVKERTYGLKITEGGRTGPLGVPERDEITTIL